MCVFLATYGHWQRLAVLLSVITGIGRHPFNCVQAQKGIWQPGRSLRLVATQRHNVSEQIAGNRTDHQGAVTDDQSSSTGSNSSKVSAKETYALTAARKHDRFCEEFCYHMFTIDDEEPTQILRRPCKRGCLRMYSQGAMGACDCDPFEPAQDPKGGPLKQGSRGGCHTFIDPGQGFNWHASCLDLYDKDHGFVVDQPGYRTPEEVTARLTFSCKLGWQCGLVMSGCTTADQLSVEYSSFKNSDNVTAQGLIKEVCTR